MNRKLSFVLMEQINPLRTRSIVDLCDYLTDKLLVPRFAANGANWRKEYMDFFTFDNTCDPLQPTGTINFHVPPLFAGCAASLEHAVTVELAKLDIKVGRVTVEPHPATSGAAILHIPIVDNPTALLQPPEVNMSLTRGTVVLRDLLGYKPVNGRYEFTADGLLKRLTKVTEQRIAACTASPVREVHSSGAVRRLPSPVSTGAVRRCLEEVRLFAIWAVEHGFHSLAAA
jgi:hypothetical protein